MFILAAILIAILFFIVLVWAFKKPQHYKTYYDMLHICGVSGYVSGLKAKASKTQDKEFIKFITKIDYEFKKFIVKRNENYARQNKLSLSETQSLINRYAPDDESDYVDPDIIQLWEW